MGMLHGDFEVIEPPPAAAAQPEIATNATGTIRDRG